MTGRQWPAVVKAMRHERGQDVPAANAAWASRYALGERHDEPLHPRGVGEAALGRPLPNGARHREVERGKVPGAVTDVAAPVDDGLQRGDGAIEVDGRAGGTRRSVAHRCTIDRCDEPQPEPVHQ